ncbi:Putative bi-domain oxidoreductase [Frankia alni ACN14a]|uniref:Bi-domain oxidoreductase n=1 Tax=Frankia alni (strain DSM 45986 / CECT 9034 / ACN14a) TaxID=326424 RepID=Q0RSE6_FRAAA|nr:Putative bi-domain oxidoreductase [Frankia alni ACN14a]
MALRAGVARVALRAGVARVALRAGVSVERRSAAPDGVSPVACRTVTYPGRRRSGGRPAPANRTDERHLVHRHRRFPFRPVGLSLEVTTVPPTTLT